MDTFVDLIMFEPAVQLGMTATPRNEETRNIYLYFGTAVYTYTLKQGIEDGFLAPYRVRHVKTTADAEGWQPIPGQTDRHGERIPDKVYNTEDFDKTLVLRPRTGAIAQDLTDHLKEDPYAKTIVFCVDQEHADTMREILSNLNAEHVQRYPDYVSRITADEGDFGRERLSRFQDIEDDSIIIVTTSKLLTTGVDAPTVKNIAIVRGVGSMVEFKQMIGRGTRVCEEYDKFTFDIIDYTGTSFKHFTDPDFDGEPIGEAEMEALGAEGVPCGVGAHGEPIYNEGPFGNPELFDQLGLPRKYLGEHAIDYSTLNCPNAEQVYREEVCSFSHAMFLGDTDDMQLILDAFQKIRTHVDEL